MKILYVNKLYPPQVGGGAERTLQHLAEGVARRGHDVRIATTTPGHAEVVERISGLHVHRLPLRNLYWHNDASRKSSLMRAAWHAWDVHNLAMAAALRRVVREFSPDVISFHNLAGFSAAAWAVASQAGKPALQVLHDYYHLCPKSQMFRAGSNCEQVCASCRLFRMGRARASAQLQGVVGVSRAVLDAHLQRGLFAEVALKHVVHNARPLPNVAARGCPDLATTFGFIGTLGAWKGLDGLLAGFRRAAASLPGRPLRLLVAGRGEVGYEQRLRATYESAQIQFLGPTEPQAFYPLIDASIVPSAWNEPLGMVAAESLIYGAPVIGARRGGLPEMVAHQVNGLLYEPDHPGALERCVLQLATTSGMLRSLSQRASQSVARFASLDRMVDEYLGIYQVLGERQSLARRGVDLRSQPGARG